VRALEALNLALTQGGARDMIHDATGLQVHVVRIPFTGLWPDGRERVVGAAQEDPVEHQGMEVHVGDSAIPYTAARISSAARSPERTAPSMAPYEIVAVSVPAQ